MTNDARLSHTFCDHAKTPAARKLCRAGDAIVRQARMHDHLVIGGKHYSVRHVVAFSTTPAEVRVAEYRQGTGWVDLGWCDAQEFAKATIVKHDEI